MFAKLRAITAIIGLSGFISAATITGAMADDHFIILQSTTSTQSSGLYEHLLPIYEAASNVAVRVVAVGTGQAISNAQRCDGDILIVHSRSDELAFVADGYGTERHRLMFNDFVIIGPKTDPAGITKMNGGAAGALRQIAKTAARFASRGDNSGTHKAERRQWKMAGVNPASPDNKWYLETGRGMGATLNLAIESDAYTLSDRATWLAFGRKADHEILVHGDPSLFNQYGVIPVNPTHCPNVKHQAALAFRDWLISTSGQRAIASYRRNGQQLFFANAE